MLGHNSQSSSSIKGNTALHMQIDRFLPGREAAVSVIALHGCPIRPVNVKEIYIYGSWRACPITSLERRVESSRVKKPRLFIYRSRVEETELMSREKKTNSRKLPAEDTGG